jgi:hypothetical protein
MKGAHVVMANRNIVQSQKLKDEIIFAKVTTKFIFKHLKVYRRMQKLTLSMLT